MDNLPGSKKVIIKHPLRMALTVPFVIIIIATVGLTGYIAFINGQAAVNNIVEQLFSEIEIRVEQHMDSYLGTAFMINQLNLNSVLSGRSNSSDLEYLAQFFWERGLLFPGFGTMGFGNDKGEIAGSNDVNKIMVIANQSPTGIVLHRYAVGDDGKRTDKIVSETRNYDARTRSWYQTGVKAKQPAWTEINAALAGPWLALSAVTPYYGKDESLIGVFYTDVPLLQINQYLQNITISPNGQMFIMENNGLIVASSTPEQPYLITGDQIERLNASSSSQPLIASAARYLTGQFDGLGKIPPHYNSSFNFQGEKHFVHVNSYNDARGLDWKIVMVVPESDFMAQITQNNRNTLVFIIISALFSVIVSALLARRITRPITNLSRSAKALANGDYDQRLEIKSEDELGELTDAFNTMAVKLKENTASLQESEERFRALVEQAPEAILVLDCDNFMFVDANKKAEELFGCGREELLKSGPEQFYTSNQVDEKPVSQVMQENTQRALAGETVSYVRRIKSTDGKEHLCQVWMTRLPSAYPKFVRISYIDITESKRTEEELRKYREHLEELVKERTAQVHQKNEELEKFNKFFVGRELKMIELKKKIAQLEKEIGGLKNPVENQDKGSGSQ